MKYGLIPEPSYKDFLPNYRHSPPFDWQNKTIFFSSGRIALLNGIKLLRGFSVERNEVLVPAYFCEEALWPLRDAGFIIKYYTIDQNFSLKLPEIEAEITKNTLAILAVHYFGIPQDFMPLKNLCAKRGVFFVEDCAHAFYGRANGFPLGQNGDISVFSLQKFICLPDGGALIVNNSNLIKNAASVNISPNNKRSDYLRTMFRASLNLLENECAMTIKKKRLFLSEDIRELCPRSNLENERNLFDDSLSISECSRRMFSRSDYASMALRRKINYGVFLNCLMDVPEIKIPFPCVEDGCSPYVFPVLVPEAIHVKVIRTIINRGIIATDWPTLPVDLTGEKNIIAVSILSKIILLPIHQNISFKQMNIIAKIVKQAIEQGLRKE